MAVEYPAEYWKDYELRDSGRGEKLERFGKYVLRRPEPKALWDPSLPEAEWRKRTHVVFKPGAGFGKAGEGYIRISSFNSRANVLEAIERIKAL